MTYGFALLTAGTLLLYSGWSNSTIAEVMRGLAVRKGGAGDTGFVSLITAPAAGVGEAIAPNSGGNGPHAGDIRAPKNKTKALAAAVAKASQMSGRYPYVWGGGHSQCGKPDGGTGRDPGIGYDCSGAVSAVLCAMGMLSSPLTSGSLAAYGEAGPGRWITIYANAEHTFMKINGIWFGTGSNKEALRGGPAWGNHDDVAGYAVRHPRGF
jgi:hypothetical protein